MPEQSQINIPPRTDEIQTSTSQATEKKGKRAYSLKELEQKLEKKRLEFEALQAKADAKRAALEAQKNKAARDLETRMKVLLGAYLLHKMKDDPALKKHTYAQMRLFLKKANEKKLFEDQD